MDVLRLRIAGKLVWLVTLVPIVMAAAVVLHQKAASPSAHSSAGIPDSLAKLQESELSSRRKAPLPLAELPWSKNTLEDAQNDRRLAVQNSTAIISREGAVVLSSNIDPADIGSYIVPTIAPAVVRIATPRAGVGIRLSPIDLAAESELDHMVTRTEQERLDQEAILNTGVQAIKISADPECGPLPPVAVISPTHFSLDFKNIPTRMFVFRVTGAKNKLVRFDLTNVALSRWETLNPVIGDVENISTPGSFEWQSGDEKLDLKEASNNVLIPLTPHQRWHYAATVWDDHKTTLSFDYHFQTDIAYVAMKFPYSPKLFESRLQAWKEAEDINIEHIGISGQSRQLSAVIINGQSPTSPTVVMYAREHADENDTSWVVDGAISFLLGRDGVQFRNTTFILVPIVDPDAAVQNVHEHITTAFMPGRETVESKLYSKFFQNWVNAGKRLDVVMDLHNLESGEGPHLMCPLMEPPIQPSGINGVDLHNLILTSFTDAAFSVNQRPGELGFERFRLGGWLRQYYGTLCLPYEVNSQERSRHLSIRELQEMGARLAKCASGYLHSPAGENLMRVVDNRRALRNEGWQCYGSDLSVHQDDPLQSEQRCCWLLERAEYNN